MSLLDYAETVFKNLYMNNVRLNQYAYKASQNTKFDTIISNDKACFEIIKSEYEFQIDNYPIHNLNRASHILITWILGIGISKSLSINTSTCYDFDCGFGKQNWDILWLQSAIIHDYGYFRKELSNNNLTLNEICGKYSLLRDDYGNGELSYLNGMSQNGFREYFTYTYDEIKNYFDLRKNMLCSSNNTDGDELLDHGIIGGCIAFRKYCEQLQKSAQLPSITIIQVEKIACYTAASHNIFKSDSCKNDELYQQYELNNLLSHLPPRINESNPLLLLLSLIDTIECTKRFSKKENPEEYLEQKTTLKYVNIESFQDKIVLDFFPLFEYLKNTRKSENMCNKLMKHIEQIKGLKNWTSIKVSEINKYSLSISK